MSDKKSTPPGQRSLLQAAREHKAHANLPAPKRLPEIVRKEILVAACGHGVEFPIFPDKQDGFRAERRNKAIGMKCAECRRKDHEARIVQQKAEAAERKRLKRERLANRQRAHPETTKGRLPHGTVFTAIYDGVAIEWSGSLLADGELFTATAGGLFPLAILLDKKYREFLSQNEANGRLVEHAGENQQPEREPDGGKNDS